MKDVYTVGKKSHTLKWMMYSILCSVNQQTMPICMSPYCYKQIISRTIKYRQQGYQNVKSTSGNFHFLQYMGISITIQRIQAPTPAFFAEAHGPVFYLWLSQAREEANLIALHGPLSRYVKLRVAHALGMPGTFSPPLRVSDPDIHHGMCVTHLPWCMSVSLTSGFLWSR